MWRCRRTVLKGSGSSSSLRSGIYHFWFTGTRWREKRPERISIWGCRRHHCGERKTSESQKSKVKSQKSKVKPRKLLDLDQAACAGRIFGFSGFQLVFQGF